MALTNNDIFMMLSRVRLEGGGAEAGNNNSSGNSRSAGCIPLLALIMQFRLRGSNDLCPSLSLERGNCVDRHFGIVVAIAVVVLLVVAAAGGLNDFLLAAIERTQLL